MALALAGLSSGKAETLEPHPAVCSPQAQRVSERQKELVTCAVTRSHLRKASLAVTFLTFEDGALY